MSKQEYTVFTSDGDDFLCTACYAQGLSLDALITRGLIHFGVPYVAWAAELPISYGGTKSFRELYAESVLAGRLIEKTASGWVALGAEKQEESDLPELVKNFHQRELRKVEQTPADIAMARRDDTTAARKYAMERELIARVNAMHREPLSTAKPNPFPTTLRSPDCDSGPSDHLNASRHQMAGMSKS